MVIQGKLNNAAGLEHEYVSTETCRVKIRVASDGTITVDLLSDADVEEHLLSVASASSGLPILGQ